MDRRIQSVSAHIDRAFVERTTRSKDQADYASTPMLAELFKRSGADGVVYKRNFGDDGYNIALFDPSTADLVRWGLFEVKRVTLQFDQVDDLYYVLEKAHDG